MIQKNLKLILLSGTMLFSNVIILADTPLFPSSSANADIPLLINSDHVEMNYKTGVNIYQGHVIVNHGQSQLTADKMMTYRDNSNKIARVITTGSPATLHSEEDKDEQPLDAKANRITYYPPTHVLILAGDANAIQAKNMITAPLIHYNTETKMLQAHSTPAQQTHILIHDDNAQPTEVN